MISKTVEGAGSAKAGNRRAVGRRPGLIRYHRDLLPVRQADNIVTLLEGNTPLIRCRDRGRIINPDIERYLKLEGLNPTCSFKDRGMTVAITKAVEEGSKAVICPSTAKTSASAAAYAALLRENGHK